MFAKQRASSKRAFPTPIFRDVDATLITFPLVRIFISFVAWHLSFDLGQLTLILIGIIIVSCTNAKVTIHETLILTVHGG